MNPLVSSIVKDCLRGGRLDLCALNKQASNLAEEYSSVRHGPAFSANKCSGALEIWF